MIIVECPHCKGTVEIEQINCAIFRHAILKSNGQQINPHERKEVCFNLRDRGLIQGCGMPFKIVFLKTENGEDGYEAQICDWI